MASIINSVDYQSVAPEEHDISYEGVPGSFHVIDSVSPKESPLITKPRAEWTIGLYTPTLIAASYILGLGTAIAHFYFFNYLNGKDVETSIRQAYVATISNLLVRVFSLSVGIALGTAYTQILWSALRQKFLSLGMIDRMFSMATGPLNLLHFQTMLTNPLIWLTALLLPLIPIATIFPPGAVTVRFVPVSWTRTMLVPSYDFNYRGTNDSYVNLKNYALFNLGADGIYTDPKPNIERLVKSSFLQGGFLTADSPCGDNCTYELQMAGPEFVCQDNLYSNLPALMSEVYGNSTNNIHFDSSSTGVNFIAATNSTLTTHDDGKFALEVEWRNGSENTTSTLACDLWASNYTLYISYQDKVQTVAVTSVKQHLLNGSYLSGTDLFYNETFDSYPDSFILPMVGVPVSTAFRESNIRAIFDSLVGTIGGGVSNYGNEQQFVANTDILVSPLATYSTFYDIYLSPTVSFSLSASVLQSLLQNFTVSLLTTANTQTETTVSGVTYTQQYIFTPRSTLIIPYATTVAVSLLFLVIGLIALRQNGVSAASGGFLQILCATKGSKALDDAVKEGSVGGSQNVSEELKGLHVMFGEMKGRAGFGARGEVKALVKGGL